MGATSLPLVSPLERRLALSGVTPAPVPEQLHSTYTLAAEVTEGAVYVSARANDLSAEVNADGAPGPSASGGHTAIESHDLLARAVSPVSGEILSLAATDYREIEVEGVTVALWRLTLPDGIDPNAASFRFELDADTVLGPVLPASLFSEASITVGDEPPPAMLAARPSVHWHHTLPQSTFIGTPNNSSWVSQNGYTVDPNLNIHDQKWGWELDGSDHHGVHGNNNLNGRPWNEVFQERLRTELSDRGTSRIDESVVGRVRDGMMKDYGLVDPDGKPLKGNPAAGNYPNPRPPNHGAGPGTPNNGAGGGAPGAGSTQTNTAGVVKKSVIRGGKFLVTKSGVGTVIFFAYDTYQGGPLHAANEALWPLSEIWR